MSIPKRLRRMCVKQRPLTPRQKHERLCQDIYNRLQHMSPEAGDDWDAEEINKLAAELMGISKAPSVPTINFCLRIMERLTTEHSTLQINYPTKVTHRVMLSCINYAAEPVYGHIYPSLAVVKTSHLLVVSTMLAYIELCKHAGKWL